MTTRKNGQKRRAAHKNIKKTRKNFKKRMIGGAYVEKNEFMFHLNRLFTADNIASSRFNDFVNFATLTNPGVLKHTFDGRDYYIGVVRGMLKNKGPGPGYPDNTYTDTTTADRHPYSIHHPWMSGWGGAGPDNPLLFIMKKYTQADKEANRPPVIRFFEMKNQIADLRPGGAKSSYMEDPRIAFCPTNAADDGGGIFVFTAHTGDISFADPKYGRDRAKAVPEGADIPAGTTFELGPLKTDPATGARILDHKQVPVVTWISKTKMHSFIRANFINYHRVVAVHPTEGYQVENQVETVIDINTVRNNKPETALWRPVCSNFLTNSQDKNFAIIPRYDAADPEKNYIDFIYSAGLFTKSLVVLRYPVQKLKKSVWLEDSLGAFDYTTHACDYIQTLGGLIVRKGPGDTGNVVRNELYDIPTNNRISEMANLFKRWTNIIINLYANWMDHFRQIIYPANNAIYSNRHKNVHDDSFAFEFGETNGVRTFKFKIPILTQFSSLSFDFLRKSQADGIGFPLFSAEVLNGKAYPILNGISTGGTMCDKYGQVGEKPIKLGVGHLKLDYAFCYILYAACFDYRDPESNQGQEGVSTFKAYFDGQVPADIGIQEKDEIKEFIKIIYDEESIFKRIYDFIKSNNLFNSRYFKRGYCDPAHGPHYSAGVPASASPMCPSYRPAEPLDVVEYTPWAPLLLDRGTLKQLIPIHHSLVYSSFLFSLNVTDYKLLSIGRQFFFKTNYAAGQPPTGLLQFAHSIDLDNEKYLIGFGNDDAQCYISKIKYDNLHALLKAKGTEHDVDLTTGVPEENKYEYFRRLFKTFFAYNMMAVPEAYVVPPPEVPPPPPHVNNNNNL